MSKSAADVVANARIDILAAMLSNVVFDGWSAKALMAGVEQAGFEPVMANRAFPRGLADVVRFWSEQSDAAMLEHLDTLDIDTMRVRDRIAIGVQTRIMVNADNREALRRCMAWLALPFNAPMAMKNALRTVNEMWYAAGDQSVDWNYYSKRGLLLPVYTTTVLYWLADEPDENGDYPETWGYLDRRIDDVLKTFGMPGKMKKRFEDSGLSGLRFFQFFKQT